MPNFMKDSKVLEIEVKDEGVSLQDG